MITSLLDDALFVSWLGITFLVLASVSTAISTSGVRVMSERTRDILFYVGMIAWILTILILFYSVTHFK